MSRFWLNFALALTLLLCGAGFVHFTAVALYRQEHGVIGAEHPWDFWAEGCIVLAIVAVALLLARAEHIRPMRWRKARPTSTGQGAKRRRRVGYNRPK